MAPETRKLIKEIKKYYNVQDLSEINQEQWTEISGKNPKWLRKLPEEFIDMYSDKLNWYYISLHQKLSEPFIEKHAEDLNWAAISETQKLSESFIEKHEDKVNWYYICGYQELSENFIKKYKEKLEWSRICQYQKLSVDFIKKYGHRYIDFISLSKNKHITPDIIETFKDKLYWYYVSKSPVMNEELADRYSEWLDFDAFVSENFPSTEFLLKYKDRIDFNLLIDLLALRIKSGGKIKYSKKDIVNLISHKEVRYIKEQTYIKILEMFKPQTVKDILTLTSVIKKLEQNLNPYFPRNYKRSELIRLITTQKRWKEFFKETADKLKEKGYKEDVLKNMLVSEVLNAVDILALSLNIEKEKLLETVKKSLKKYKGKNDKQIIIK